MPSDESTSTTVGPLDLTDPKDLALLKKLATDGPGKKKKRWEGITDEFKGNAVQALRAALHMAVKKESPRDITRCVEVVARIEGQNQLDEHLDRKEARLDDGAPTENQVVKVEFVNRITNAHD